MDEAVDMSEIEFASDDEQVDLKDDEEYTEKAKQGTIESFYTKPK